MEKYSLGGFNETNRKIQENFHRKLSIWDFSFIFCISKQVVQATRQDILGDNRPIQRNTSKKILTKFIESLLVYTV